MGIIRKTWTLHIFLMQNLFIYNYDTLVQNCKKWLLTIPTGSARSKIKIKLTLQAKVKAVAIFIRTIRWISRWPATFTLFWFLLPWLLSHKNKGLTTSLCPWLDQFKRSIPAMAYCQGLWILVNKLSYSYKNNSFTTISHLRRSQLNSFGHSYPPVSIIAIHEN